jgi:hypothetical protein
MECGQVKRLTAYALSFITGIFRNYLQKGELVKVGFLAGKLGNTPKLMPMFIMSVFKAGNIAKVRFDIHTEGDVSLVVMKEWTVKHSWITTP